MTNRNTGHCRYSAPRATFDVVGAESLSDLAGVKDGIENGIDAVGGAIGDAGSAIGSGVKQVWGSVF